MATETIGQAADKVLERLSHESTSPGLPARRKAPATHTDIAAAVLRTEILKQIRPPLTDQQREALVIEIATQGWTPEQLQQRARSVALKQTYGTIAFEYWTTELVCLRSEAESIAQQMISENAQRYVDYGHTSGRFPGARAYQEAARLGLLIVERAADERIREMAAEHARDLAAKIKQMRAQFYSLPDRAKVDLWSKAVARGFVQDGDPYAMEILPQLVAKMPDEFEDAIRAASNSA